MYKPAKPIQHSKKVAKLPVIGPSVLVSVDQRAVDIPAKIDTGAESSAIWASNVHIDEQGILEFTLFGPGSPFYTGEVYRRSDYKVFTVRSAMGEEQIRYRTHLSLTINDRHIKVLFSLADRSKNSFPILIGRSTIKGRFLVDVSLPDVKYERKPKKPIDLKEFRTNPHRFHQKYVAKTNQKGE